MKSSFSNNGKKFAGADLAKNVKRTSAVKKPKKSNAGKKGGGSELAKNVK